MKTFIGIIATLLLLSSLLFSCQNGKDASASDGDYLHSFSFGPGQEDEIRAALISIEDSTEILLAEGTYQFEKLSIQGPRTQIMFRGAGSDKTIIDFSQQETGGEGIRVDGVNQFTIRDMRIQESRGDLIKVKDGEGVNFVNLHTVWAGEPDTFNGGYGIYPVLCKDVMIDSCFARGASDAGVYVGQTIGAVVKNSRVEYCVAGIEIENTQNAEVFNNEATNNTGGLLIFDHPGLAYDGKNTLVYGNNIHDNNYRNFAPAANDATGVGNVPPGTGIMILRTSDVEVYDNTIKDNNTMAVGVISYATVDPGIFQNNPEFDPIPRNVYLHDNRISKQDQFPEAVKDHQLAQVIVGIYTQLKAAGITPLATIQDILYDGVVMGEGDNPSNICIQEAETTSFINLDAGGNFTNISFDPSPYNCKGSM